MPGTNNGWMTGPRSLLRLVLTAAVTVVVVAPNLGARQAANCPSCSEGAALISRFGLREGSSPVREQSGWAPPQRVVVLGPAAWAESLRAAVPGVTIVNATTTDAVERIIGSADAYIGLCTPAILSAGRKLQWIQLWSAGAEGCASLLSASRRPIVLTNAQALYGPEIAEHTVGFILAFARQLHTYRDEQRAGRWRNADIDRSVVTSWELEGKNLLVIGLGGLGTEVARRAHALGMRVRATRNTGRDGPAFVEYVGPASEATTLAAWADVVVNCTPLTNDTRRMFNAGFFAAMKPSAYFINVGRGESVVTTDLVRALQRNQIAGAALDVTDPEPLPLNHPLWRMPNVILTPHSGGGSDLAQGRALVLAAENLRRFVRGDRMVSVVDVRRGY
jgi:phosphoglycerate dehydrogenase-like enzyme